MFLSRFLLLTRRQARLRRLHRQTAALAIVLKVGFVSRLLTLRCRRSVVWLAFEAQRRRLIRTGQHFT
jgi:hypothetical protein